MLVKIPSKYTVAVENRELGELSLMQVGCRRYERGRAIYQ